VSLKGPLVTGLEIEGETETEAYRGGTVKAGLGDKVQGAVAKVEITFENAVDIVRRNAQAIIDKVEGLSNPLMKYKSRLASRLQVTWVTWQSPK